MSRVHINTHKGFDIEFDINSQQFFATINKPEYHEKKKRSYQAAVNFINKHVEDNKEFQPFDLFKYINNWGGEDIEKVTIIGQREDGLYVYRNNKNRKVSISNYEEDSYFFYNEKNPPIFEAIKKVTEEIRKLEEIKRTTKDKLILKSLKDFKEEQNT